MQLNRIVVLDFETYWRSKDYSLSKLSYIDYVRSKEFYPQLLSYSVNGNPVSVVEHEDIPAALAELNLEDHRTLTVGHNINGFDGFILSDYYNIHPFMIADTLTLANWNGVSRLVRPSLASLVEYFEIGHKDQGTTVSDGRKYPNEFGDQWQYFKEYCKQDTLLTYKLFNMLISSKVITADAIIFSNLTAKMAQDIDIGFTIDNNLLYEFIAQLDAEEREAKVKLEKMFKLPPGRTFKQTLRSDKSFAKMLELLGCQPPMKKSDTKSEKKRKELQAKGYDTSDPSSYTVMAYAFAKKDVDFLALLEHPDSRVRELVKMRLEFKTSIPESRALNLISVGETKGNMPVFLKAYAAHTGRFGAGTDGVSDGLNTQNMAKHSAKLKALRQAITVPEGYKIVACDSSQIECRVLAYASREYNLLSIFEEHRDPYAELAANFSPNYTAKEIHEGAKAGDKTLHKLRFVAKTITLGAGYGASKHVVANFLNQSNVSLGETPEAHLNKSEYYLTIYRRVNANIPAFWKMCDHVLAQLANGGAGKFGGPNNDLFTYGMYPVGKTEVASIKLPSGYFLRYPFLRYDHTLERPSYVYDKMFNGKLVPNKIYGASLTENLIQSLAFQILMWQACRMYEAGIKLKANIHDSFATIVPEEIANTTLEIMLKWMRTLPSWATGCPLDAEGEIGEDFSIV